MKRNVWFAVLFGLPIGSVAYAANPQPVPVYTFTCKGNITVGGHCPNGGRPVWIIQGSDGNFYGADWDSQKEVRSRKAERFFHSLPAGRSLYCTDFHPDRTTAIPVATIRLISSKAPTATCTAQRLLVVVPMAGFCSRIGKDGSDFKILHEFCSSANCADGAGPGMLVSGDDGNVYGTSAGGANGYGIIFRVIPSSGGYNVLFNFGATLSLNYPSAPTPGPDGTLYGLQGKV